MSLGSLVTIVDGDRAFGYDDRVYSVRDTRTPK